MLALAPLLLLQAAPVPGASEYFQQHVEYTLEARLDEERDVLEGAGILTYQNNAPQSLDTLYFHLYLNAFRPNSIWATTEGREEFDFQGLDAEAAAFHRMTAMAVGDRSLTPVYPYAPDSTGTPDYAVGAIRQERRDGSWYTAVEVERRGENWMPITVRIGETDRRLEGREEVQTLEVTTDGRPATVELDPDLELVDTDRENNTAELDSPG